MNREEVSMGTLEAGTTLNAASNRHCHTEKFSGNTYQDRYLLENTYENTIHPAEGEERERESTTIRKKATIDPL